VFDGERLEAVIEGEHVGAAAAFSPGLDRVWLSGLAGHIEVAEHDLLNRDEEAGAGGATLRAPLSGKVIRILTEPGARVDKGQRLLILEAMKMEHAVTAGFDAVVESLGAAEGEQVEEGRVLVLLAAVE
jgi:acetyl/propionyl-CoA carboxylase alpha subunit